MQLARCAILFALAAISLAHATEISHGSEGRKLLQQTQAVEPPVAKPEQLIIVPAPVAPSNCMAFSDAQLRATRGSVLCTSQYISYNVTKVICNEWKPECQQTVTEYKLIDPAVPGADQNGYATTATAACKLLGYQTFGTGTVHMIGDAKRDLLDWQDILNRQLVDKPGVLQGLSITASWCACYKTLWW